MEIVNRRYHMPTPLDVYIARPSPLGNPYSHKADTLAQFRVASRRDAIAAYEAWLRERLAQRDAAVLAEFARLSESSVLVCWCDPEPCHGVVVVKLWRAWARAGDAT